MTARPVRRLGYPRRSSFRRRKADHWPYRGQCKNEAVRGSTKPTIPPRKNTPKRPMPMSNVKAPAGRRLTTNSRPSAMNAGPIPTPAKGVTNDGLHQLARPREYWIATARRKPPGSRPGRRRVETRAFKSLRQHSVVGVPVLRVVRLGRGDDHVAAVRPRVMAAYRPPPQTSVCLQSWGKPWRRSQAMIPASTYGGTEREGEQHPSDRVRRQVGQVHLDHGQMNPIAFSRSPAAVSRAHR